jgi:hypothetical protein
MFGACNKDKRKRKNTIEYKIYYLINRKLLKAQHQANVWLASGAILIN